MSAGSDSYVVTRCLNYSLMVMYRLGGITVDDFKIFKKIQLFISGYSRWCRHKL